MFCENDNIAFLLGRKGANQLQTDLTVHVPKDTRERFSIVSVI